MMQLLLFPSTAVLLFAAWLLLAGGALLIVVMFSLYSVTERRVTSDYSVEAPGHPPDASYSNPAHANNPPTSVSKT
jgi:hypothetical protein